MGAPLKIHSLPVKLSAGAALVALADLFFYGHPLGWAAGMYGMALLGVVSALHGGLLKRRENQVLALLLCALSAVLVAAPAPLPLSLYAAGIVALLIFQKRLEIPDVTLALKDVVKFLWRILWQWKRDRGVLHSLRQRKKIAAVRRAAAGLFAIAPAAFAVTFALLFMQANPVIGRIMGGIDWDSLWTLLSPWRFLFWVCAALPVWAVLRPRFRPATPSAPVALPDLDRWFNPASVRASLLLFNILFAVQSGLDIAFLWSGKPLPDGLTYAEYAHDGAYPLIVTALLAAAYILITFSDKKYQTAAARALVYLWIAQNIFLVISSIDRLFNYIEIYSLTYLRLSALIWMGLVACGLALIVVKIAQSRRNMWLINMNVLALVMTLYACCFIDFDRIIADYNVRHAQEVTGAGTSLDIPYIQSLGYETLPALRWFQLNAKYSPLRAASAGALADGMEQSLARDLNRDWRAWTWRNQARLDEIMSRLTPPPRPLDHTGWNMKE